MAKYLLTSNQNNINSKAALQATSLGNNKMPRHHMRSHASTNKPYDNNHARYSGTPSRSAQPNPGHTSKHLPALQNSRANSVTTSHCVDHIKNITDLLEKYNLAKNAHNEIKLFFINSVCKLGMNVPLEETPGSKNNKN